MKIVALFACLFGTSFALPRLPLRLAPGSSSTEMLLSLGLGLDAGAGAGGLVPQLQQMHALNPFIPSLPVLELVQQQQQQPQNTGLPQNLLAVRTPFAARLTNQIRFPGQVSFPGLVSLGTQQGQQDPMQSQVPQQNQQLPNQMMPYIISYGMLPTMGQNIPPFTQLGYVPQRGGFVMPGGQQQPVPNDLLPGSGPVTQTMPAANAVPHFPNEIMNYGNVKSGALMLSPSQTPTTSDALTSSKDPVQNKVNTNLMNEP